MFSFARWAREIGRHARVNTLAVPVAAHRLDVGDHAVISRTAALQGYVAAGNRLHFGDVRLGKSAYVGHASVLDIDTAIGDFGQLGHASSLQAGQRVPDGKRFHGSPAEETQTNFVLTDEAACSSLRRATSTWLLLLGAAALLAAMTAAAAYVLAFLEADLAAAPKTLFAAAAVAAPTALWLASAIFFGRTVLGLAKVLIVPRLIGRFLAEGRIYPLFGVHHALQRASRWASNSPFFNLLFGDSVAIERYLRLIGWRIGRARLPGANLGTAQTQENPLLCALGDGAVASDGLNFINVTESSHAFRLGECRIGANNFLGNDIYVPAGVRTGDNCLFATKVMAPIDGPVRENVGLLGSPAFEIPRSVARDTDALLKFDHGERQRRIKLKSRHNLASALMLLSVRWSVQFLWIYAATVTWAMSGRVSVIAFSAVAVVVVLLTTGVLVLAERASTGFRRLRPEFATVYDPHYWAIERYWKLSASWAIGGLFTGTPFRPLLWRAMGVEMGRKVFDDGCHITEHTLVAVGDGANLNAGSKLQAHSLEDGAFKSDTIRVGARASLGVGSFTLYGVTLEDDVIVDADSFVMKGEVAPAASRWRGNPARMIGAEAQQALAA